MNRSIVVLLTLLPVLAQAAPEVLGYLPAEPAKPAGPAEHFVGKKLFDYMNGGAELYLAYGFVDIGVRDYQKDGAKATVEIYQMGGPAEAFGIYAQAARGKAVEVPVPATLASGMLSFFKGRFYVRVVAKTKPEEKFLTALGKQVAAKLPGESKPPFEISLLPKNPVSGSLRYLTDPQTARTLWFEGEGELLLTAGARAVSAFYTVGDEDLQATRAVYPSKAAAVAACKALTGKLKLKETGGECSSSGKTPEDVFAMIAARDGVLRWVTGAPDLKVASQLLEKIK